MITEIWLAALIAGLIQLIEHWFPWRMFLGRDLPRLAAYILGVLGFLVPLTWLFVIYQEWVGLIAIWAVVVASGAAVAWAYGVDWVMDRVRRSYEHEEMINAKTRSEQ